MMTRRQDILGDDHESNVAQEVAKAVDAARTAMRTVMETQGLDPSKGWWIDERVREVEDGMTLSFRVAHLHEPGPGFEIQVVIASSGVKLEVVQDG